MPSHLSASAAAACIVAVFALAHAACGTSAPERASTIPPAPAPAPNSVVAPAQHDNQRYRVETLQLTMQPALAIRTQAAEAELEDTMGQIMTMLIGYAMLNGVELAGPPYARYFARSPERIDFEAGIPTRKRLDGDPELGIAATELPAGPAATTMHRGPYQYLPRAHAALSSWANENGRDAAGPAWEVFLSNPQQEPDPAKWRTKVFLPLSP